MNGPIDAPDAPYAHRAVIPVALLGGAERGKVGAATLMGRRASPTATRP